MKLRKDLLYTARLRNDREMVYVIRNPRPANSRGNRGGWDAEYSKDGKHWSSHGGFFDSSKSDGWVFEEFTESDMLKFLLTGEL